MRTGPRHPGRGGTPGWAERLRCGTLRDRVGVCMRALPALYLAVFALAVLMALPLIAAAVLIELAG